MVVICALTPSSRAACAAQAPAGCAGGPSSASRQRAPSRKMSRSESGADKSTRTPRRRASVATADTALAARARADRRDARSMALRASQDLLRRGAQLGARELDRGQVGQDAPSQAIVSGGIHRRQQRGDELEPERRFADRRLRRGCTGAGASTGSGSAGGGGTVSRCIAASRRSVRRPSSTSWTS